MSEVPLDSDIRIRAETSVVDPDTCKFIVDRVVHPGGPFAFDRRRATDDFTLPSRLLTLEAISAVVIADTTVSVTKERSASWEGLRSQIGAEIRAHLEIGRPAIVEPHHSGRDDQQVRAAIEQLVDREVNPTIAAHGGKISVVEVRNGVLSIAMSGGCQGCASSTATLRDGFETMARRVAPELTQIVDITNHAAGTAPFYAKPSASNADTSPLQGVQSMETNYRNQSGSNCA
ncbi:NifU family protein [bacterium]|jgi:Fe-S cluster biogenesis protein NfuA|nr:NifU family protein [bacterium]MDB4109714.1 NifU family protein [bacterium]